MNWLKRLSSNLKIAWYSDARVIKPFYLMHNQDTGKGYLQIGWKPPKHFAVKMNSGRLGIMCCTDISSYSDFGHTCYQVDFRFTGLYMQSGDKR